MSSRHVRGAVEAPEALDDRANHRVDLVGLRDVRRHERALNASRVHQRKRLLAAGSIDIAHHHRRAALRERNRSRAPDPRAGAGAECHGRHRAGTLTRG
jgi:hypothetical protein